MFTFEDRYQELFTKGIGDNVGISGTVAVEAFSGGAPSLRPVQHRNSARPLLTYWQVRGSRKAEVEGWGEGGKSPEPCFAHMDDTPWHVDFILF